MTEPIRAPEGRQPRPPAGGDHAPVHAFDERPLWRILGGRAAPFLPVLLSLGVLGAVLVAPTPEGLTVQGQRALGVFAVAFALWTTQVLPLPATSLLVMALLPLLGVADAAQTYAYFGNRAVFFLLGVFVLTAAVGRWGLSTRLSVAALRVAGAGPLGLLWGILGCGAFLSFWMPEHAVAALLFPVVGTIARSLDGVDGGPRLARGLYLAMAWGCVTGGAATLLGGARGPLALAILERSAGQTLSFLDWMLAAAPVSLGAMASAAALLWWLYGRGAPADLAPVRAALMAEGRALGRVKFGEKAVGAIAVLTVAAWIGWGEQLGLASISLAAVAVVFLLRLLTWQEAERAVHWGVVVLYGGAIALGSALHDTGAALWVARTAVAGALADPWALVAGLALTSLLVTEAMSNAAVVALLLPLGLSLGAEVGLDPRLVTLAVAVPSGFSFALPIGTPATALAFSSGRLRMGHLAWPGLLLNAAAFALILGALGLWWPMLGLGG
ncbi:MAG: SLC13 family permease [Deferrisomatales bacterium]